MTALSPGLDAALADVAVRIFIAVEIVLPGGPLRLLDGAGTLTFGGKTFAGRDPNYGTLGRISSINDGVDAEAPRIMLELMPPTMAAAAALASPTAQGSAVQIWFGAVEPATGLVIDEPDLSLVGEVDVPILRVGKGSRILEYEVSSVWERFFRNDEGARLTDAFHQSIRPGERGFAYVSDVLRQLPWGTDLPRPTVVTDVPNPPPGGGGWWGGGGGFEIF